VADGVAEHAATHALAATARTTPASKRVMPGHRGRARECDRRWLAPTG
jgi:hypothetical protein